MPESACDYRETSILIFREDMMDNKADSRQKKKRFEHWQAISLVLMIYDFLAVSGAYFLALLVRFDLKYSLIPYYYIEPFNRFILPYAAGAIVVFMFFRMYKSVWRYASYTELTRTLVGSIVASIVHTVLITVLLKRMPISYYMMGAFFQFFLLVAARFSFRFIQMFRRKHEAPDANGKRIMLIGAGNAAQMILRDMAQATEVSDRVVCIIDDNPNKWRRDMDGIPIIGGREEILRAVEQYKVDEIFLAIPSATAEQKRDILAICSETNCKLKQLPGLYQFVVGEATVSAMKDVSVEDLLGRDPIKTDMHEVFEFITGKTVLVTGGGGSIGSELCRQVAAHHPKQLIIFDIYENNLWGMQPLVT